MKKCHHECDEERAAEGARPGTDDQATTVYCSRQSVLVLCRLRFHPCDFKESMNGKTKARRAALSRKKEKLVGTPMLCAVTILLRPQLSDQKCLRNLQPPALPQWFGLAFHAIRCRSIEI